MRSPHRPIGDRVLLPLSWSKFQLAHTEGTGLKAQSKLLFLVPALAARLESPARGAAVHARRDGQHRLGHRVIESPIEQPLERSDARAEGQMASDAPPRDDGVPYSDLTSDVPERWVPLQVSPLDGTVQTRLKRCARGRWQPARAHCPGQHPGHLQLHDEEVQREGVRVTRQHEAAVTGFDERLSSLHSGIRGDIDGSLNVNQGPMKWMRNIVSTAKSGRPHLLSGGYGSIRLTTTHNPQPTTHNPQPTTHNPQPRTPKRPERFLSTRTRPHSLGAQYSPSQDSWLAQSIRSVLRKHLHGKSRAYSDRCAWTLKPPCYFCSREMESTTRLVGCFVNSGFYEDIYARNRTPKITGKNWPWTIFWLFLFGFELVFIQWFHLFVIK